MSLPKAIEYAGLPAMDLLRMYPDVRAMVLHFKNGAHQEMHHETAFSLLPDLTDRKLLDFGCGLGDFTGQLRVDMQDRYLGTDIDKDVVAAAKVLNPGWKFKYQKSVAKADVIVAVAVIADLYSDPKKLLAEMWGRCTAGVVFTCWQHFNTQDDLARMCPKPPDVILYRDDFFAVAMYK